MKYLNEKSFRLVITDKDSVIDFLILTWKKMEFLIKVYLISLSIFSIMFSIATNFLKMKDVFSFLLLSYFIFLISFSIIFSISLMFHFYAYHLLIQHYPLRFFKRQSKINLILMFLLYFFVISFLVYYVLTANLGFLTLIKKLTFILFLLSFIFIFASNGLTFLNVLVVSKLSLNPKLKYNFLLVFLTNLTLAINLYLSVKGFIEDNLFFIFAGLLSSILLIASLNKTSRDYLESMELCR